MNITVDPSIQKVPYYPKAALYGADSSWTLLSSNENPYPPSPKVIDSIVNAVLDINRYPESETELKVLLAAKYGVKPQNIVIGNGSNELIESSLRAMKYQGRTKVITTDPSFAFYPIASQIYGFEPEAVPLEVHRLNIDKVAARIDEKTRVIFLCNPNNPTGASFDDKTFLKFLKALPPEVLVVVDEAYAEFADQKKFPKSIRYINDYPLVIMRTFSKAYGLAGLRIGYGIGEEKLMSFIERTKQPFSVNMFALIAAKAALSDEAHFAKVLENNTKGKAFLCDAFKALKIDYFPTEANFVLVHLGKEAESIVKRLFEKKILIRWLGGYGLTEYVRVTVGTMDENKRFLEALKKAAC
jgi:histidinol-phosphate aminotransferase